jgi:SPP1 gp7 family putative phage head morphogenesis protein
LNLADLAGQTIPATQQIAIDQALARAQALAVAQAPTLQDAARIAVDWTALNRDAVADLVGTMSDGSPLDEWFKQFVPDSVQVVRDTLLDGVARGINAEDLGRALADATDLPLQRAMTVSRTETMRAYRSASIRSYQANDDVLDGWTWSAAHDDKTCNACLAKSGDDFPLTTSFMPTHPRCRCSPIPKLDDPDGLLPGIETGKQWFDRQPEQFRRERFPVGLRGDYDAGLVDLEDMAQLRRNDVWGDAYGDATIAQARKNANTRRVLERRKAGTKPPPKPTPTPTPKPPTTRKPRATKATTTPAPAPQPAPPKGLRRKPGESDTSFKARTKIEQGINTEQDVRELGAILRPEIDKRAKAIRKEYDDAYAVYEQGNRGYLSKVRSLEGDERQAFIDGHQKAYERTLKLRESSIHAQRQATIEVIEEFRPMGSSRPLPLVNKATTKSRKAKRIIQEQTEFLPAEWVNEIIEFNRGRTMPVDTIARGKYIPSQRAIMLSGGDDTRLAGTAVHELMHALEDANPKFVQMEREFYARRTAGESLRWMGAGYRRDELTRLDQFLNPYMGKEYGGRFWELASMGVQNVLGPTQLDITKDVDFYEFILGLIAGV